MEKVKRDALYHEAREYYGESHLAVFRVLQSLEDTVDLSEALGDLRSV